MFDRSVAYDQAIIHGGNVVSYLDVQRGFGLFSVVNVLEQRVPIMGGSVTVDGNAKHRRTISVTVPNDTGLRSILTPDNPLSPYGSEIVPRVGFAWGVSNEEVLPVGVFRIQRVTATPSSLTITGIDRSEPVAAAKFESLYEIPAGTAPEAAAQTIIERVFADLTFTTQASGFTLPLTDYQEGDLSKDPWDAIGELLSHCGFEALFDAAGQPIIRAVPNPILYNPEWDYAPGADSTLLPNPQNAIDGSAIRNVVRVFGQGPGVSSVIVGEAEITDPANPIHPDRIGRRVLATKTSTITSQAQADAAADAFILLSAGAAEQTEFQAIPHPAHEAGDVVRLTVPELGLDALVVMDNFTVDLALKTPMPVRTKARRAV